MERRRAAAMYTPKTTRTPSPRKPLELLDAALQMKPVFLVSCDVNHPDDVWMSKPISERYLCKMLSGPNNVQMHYLYVSVAELPFRTEGLILHSPFKILGVSVDREEAPAGFNR